MLHGLWKRSSQRLWEGDAEITADLQAPTHGWASGDAPQLLSQDEALAKSKAEIFPTYPSIRCTAGLKICALLRFSHDCGGVGMRAGFLPWELAATTGSEPCGWPLCTRGSLGRWDTATVRVCTSSLSHTSSSCWNFSTWAKSSWLFVLLGLGLSWNSLPYSDPIKAPSCWISCHFAKL